MQGFINQSALERAVSFAFAEARSRYCLMALMGAALLAASGAPLAAIWLGLALLTDEARKILARQSLALTSPLRGRAELLLDIAGAASFAAAPAIVWFSSAPLAIAMLCVLATHGANSARSGRALAASAPYGLLGFLFALEGAAGGAFGPALAGLACIVYIFAGGLQHAHRAANSRRQDSEWVRQLNMSDANEGSAAWEIDFQRQELRGGVFLARVLGRPVCYRTLVESACFAAPADRALAHGVFAPSPGPMRRVAIEHEIIGADGARRRVRHQGVLRTDTDGAPARLSCVTQLSGGAAALGELAAIDALQGPVDGPLVIVIDENAEARELAARALIRAGFRVQGVGQGEAGLALARREAPALVLLDISRTDRSGWGVLQSLKQDAETRDAPVIVLSANEDRARAISLGAAEHIVKPADRDVLTAAVMRYARQRSQAAGAAAAPAPVKARAN